MGELRKQEIFSSGSWNGTDFSEADLDAMVQSFDALGLAGRVPLKFGHDSPKPDGQPALGWVSRVWREGSKLLADFSNVSEKVMGLIRGRAYKFVSVELLKNVRAGTREIPWVLDAVALLGADQPAVGILKELTMSARAGLRFEARVAFTRESTLKSGEHGTMDHENLRAENARLNEQLAMGEIERAINAGECLPAVRVSFSKNFPAGGGQRTLENAREWTRMNRMSESARSKFSTRATRVEPDESRRLDASDDDAIGDLFIATAKRLGITDPHNASQLDQLRIWRATRQAQPEAYSNYVASSGVA